MPFVLDPKNVTQIKAPQRRRMTVAYVILLGVDVTFDTLALHPDTAKTFSALDFC